MREICSYLKWLWRFARAAEELPPKNTKLLGIPECVPVWIFAGGDKEVIGLVFTAAQALLSHIVRSINNTGVLPHAI